MTGAASLLHRSPVPVADPTEPIARHLAPSSPRAETTFRRRRLATLAGLLGVVLAVAPFVERDAADVPVTTEASGSMTVRAASVGSPTAVRELLSETTSTLVEATGSTTTSTSTTSTTSSTSSTSSTSTSAPTTSTTAPPATTTTEAPTTTAAPSTTAAPTTTVHRHPTTTQPPATTTTTAAPSTTTSESGGGYAYDDPRSTQVWHDLAECESGGNWSIDSGNGYYGGLQFSLPTWESVGGTGYPHEHSAQTQIEMGRRLQDRQGWEAWPHCSEELGLR